MHNKSERYATGKWESRRTCLSKKPKHTMYVGAREGKRY